MHLLVDGVRIDPVGRGLRLRFTMPADVKDVWLVSTTARPSDLQEAADTRDLGVCLGGHHYQR